MVPDVEVLAGGLLQLPPEVRGNGVPVLVAGQEVVDPATELFSSHKVLQHSVQNTWDIWNSKRRIFKC